MKREILTHAAALAAGAAFAGTAVSIAWAAGLPWLVDAVTASLQHEQELLESQARRDGDRLGELVHAGMSAYLAEGIGLVWADRWRAADLDDRLRWPLDVLQATWDRPEVDPERIAVGRRIVAAQEYARFSVVASELGLEEPAEAQWRRARALAPMQTEENLREIAADPYDWAAEPYLTAQTWDELEAQLAVMRGEAEGEGP